MLCLPQEAAPSEETQLALRLVKLSHSATAFFHEMIYTGEIEFGILEPTNGEVKGMATVEQLIKQYETDKALQAEVAQIVADGKVTMMEFMAFAKKHDVAISLDELPKYMEQAKKLGFL